MAKIKLTTGGEYKKRHEASDRIIDFTDVEVRNELMRYGNVDSANIKIPEIGETHFYITTKALSLFNVINWIEQQRGEIEEIYFFVYTLNETIARYIVELSKRSKLYLIISDIMNSQREKERVITRVLEQGNSEIVFCHNHAKIISAKIGNEYITLTGSMNAGANARIETLEIFNDKKMYTFVENQYNLLKEKFRVQPRYFD